MGDVDQEVAGQPVAFRRLIVQTFEIADEIARRQRQQAHAPRDPPRHRARLVRQEILPGLLLQIRQDSRQIRPVIAARVLGACRDSVLGPGRLVPGQIDQRGGHLGERQHAIDQTGVDRAVRHARVFGLIEGLGDGLAARPLECGQSGAAVGAGARQKYRDGLCAAGSGQRFQQVIEGKPRPVARIGRGQVQGPGPYRKIASRRDDIDRIGDDRAAFARRDDLHCGMFGQQFDQQALVRRVEMLDDDERHSRRCRQRAEQPRRRFQSARRRSDRDNDNVCGRHLRGAWHGVDRIQRLRTIAMVVALQRTR